MNKMDLKPAYIAIQFVERYKKLCSQFNNFENRLRGKNTDLSEQALSKFSLNWKFDKQDTFFRTIHKSNSIEIGFQLDLSAGLVEASVDFRKADKWLTPDGRFDFIPEQLGIVFDRSKYNLPKYTSPSDLNEILTEIICIYMDLKDEILKLEIEGGI